MPGVDSLTIESGYLIVQRDSGPPQQIPIADVLRAADIPTGLDYTQVATITTLANLLVVLIRTLQKRGILDEEFKDDRGMDWDLDHLIYVVEQMGGSYHEPDFDDV
ncbi:hypothetical protein LCGC14_0383030 [marine sediment metagenome]|uniref:Uncharacterized protein n=1 Tax=marine sediment metagenome TaxID=412755 RepID=A0A0F9T7H5_9ZZZZ